MPRRAERGRGALQLQSPRRLAELTFEQLSHALISLLNEVELSFTSGVQAFRPRRILYCSAAENIMIIFYPTGVDKRSGATRYHALAVKVRERYDQLLYLRDLAELDLKVREMAEERLVDRGVTVGVLEGETLVTVAPKGFMRGAGRIGRKAYGLAYVCDEPLKVVERLMSSLERWLDARVRRLCEAVGLHEHVVDMPIQSLPSLVWSIVERFSLDLREGLRLTLRALASFLRGVHRRLLGARDLQQVKAKLEAFAASLRDSALAMSSLFPTLTQRLVRWAWRDMTGFLKLIAGALGEFS
jgi:hypothetical protein